jgi:hypothetical protein
MDKSGGSSRKTRRKKKVSIFSVSCSLPSGRPNKPAETLAASSFTQLLSYLSPFQSLFPKLHGAEDDVGNNDASPRRLAAGHQLINLTSCYY